MVLEQTVYNPLQASRKECVWTPRCIVASLSVSVKASTTSSTANSDYLKCLLHMPGSEGGMLFHKHFFASVEHQPSSTSVLMSERPLKRPFKKKKSCGNICNTNKCITNKGGV